MSPSVAPLFRPTPRLSHRTALSDHVAHSDRRRRDYSREPLDRFEVFPSPTTPAASLPESLPFSLSRPPTLPRPTSSTTTESSTKVGCSFFLLSFSSRVHTPSLRRRVVRASRGIQSCEAGHAESHRSNSFSVVAPLSLSLRVPDGQRSKVPSSGISRASDKDGSIVGRIEWDARDCGNSTLGDFIEWRIDTTGQRTRGIPSSAQLSTGDASLANRRFDSSTRTSNSLRKNNNLTNFVSSPPPHHHHSHHSFATLSPTLLSFSSNSPSSPITTTSSSLSPLALPRRFVTTDKKIRVEIIVDPSRVPTPSLGSRLSAPINAPTAFVIALITRRALQLAD